MRHAIGLALLLSGAAVAPAAAQDASEQEIIVTGKRLDDTERALKECLARKCPPLEDMAATLAHAENQFVAGQYDAARRTLSSSLGRNRKHADRYPVAVSGMYRAHSRISIHMGEGEDHERSAFGIVQALKAGLPETDTRVLIGQFDVAQMHANMGRHHSAVRVYDMIARDARAIGATVLAGQAEIRGAWMSYLYSRDPGGKVKLRTLAGESDPKLRTIALGAKILLARIDKMEGGSGASDALVSELAAASFQRTLISAPPMQPIQEGYLGDKTTSGNYYEGDPWHHSTGETGKETWIDVGFRVRADGRVEDAEILRSSGHTDWTKPVLTSISGRVYTPSNSNEDDYRVERYSYTSLKMDVTGTRLRRHSGDYRIEQIDLTSR